MLKISTIDKSPLKLTTKLQYKLIRGSNSIVYLFDKQVIVFTKDKAKFDFFLQEKLLKNKYIPKILGMYADYMNGIYRIDREVLYPITTREKSLKIRQIEEMIKINESGYHSISDCIIKFLYNNHDVKYDLSHDWLMQTKNGKIVMADPVLWTQL